MKLLYILISLALVGRVSVTKLDDYIQLVITTNNDMKNAKDLLPDIIKNIVLNEIYGMEMLSFSLAVPEYIECALQTPTYNYQDDETIQKKKEEDKIPFIDLVTGEGTSQNPIPVIDFVPGEGSSQNPIPVINLDPEEENAASITILHYEDKLEYQKCLEAEITNVILNGPTQDEILDLNFEPPTVPEEDPIQQQNRVPFPPIIVGKSRTNVPAIKSENLDSILEERRIKTTQAQRTRVIRSFDLAALGKARREITLEAITKLIRRNDRAFRDALFMCRLVGAYRSIKYPRIYIKEYAYDGRHCALLDVMGVERHIYRFIEREFWEVGPRVDGYPSIKSFLTELE